MAHVSFPSPELWRIDGDDERLESERVKGNLYPCAELHLVGRFRVNDDESSGRPVRVRQDEEVVNWLVNWLALCMLP